MIPYTIYNIFDPVCIGSHIRGEKKRSSCSRPLDLHVTHHNVIAKSVSHNLTWHLFGFLAFRFKCLLPANEPRFHCPKVCRKQCMESSHSMSLRLFI